MRLPQHEQLLNDESPQVQDLNRLAARMLLFAQRHGRLRISTKEDVRLKRYWASATSYYDKPELTEGIPFGQLVQHRLGGLAVRQLDTQDWQLRMYDVMHVTNLGSQRLSCQAIYSFGWNDEEVTKARRRNIVTPDTSKELDDLIDGFYVTDDAAWVPEMMDEFEILSAADVEYLMAQLDSFTVPVDQGAREYKDPRKNYMNYFAS